MDRQLPSRVLRGLFFALTTCIFTSHFCSALQDATAATDYMSRFDIPRNHVQLEWATSGSGLIRTTYQGKTYKWIPRDQTAGVKVGYAAMWDRSSKGYCTRSDAQTDTLKYFGKRLMAVGACPNYGKYIAFVDINGKPVDAQERFTNEVHDVAMPFSTQGCSSSGSPGDSEVPMADSGWAMYSGYMARCPFNTSVYEVDMLKDTEYDPDACNFVTVNNPLVFLDTSQKEPPLAYKPYAFHGKGGHKGFDFVGSGVGCPPYSPPFTTRPMKTPNIANDPFLCSQLSRCTNLCWPWDTNRPCYRSLPASFNHETSECLILGHHTQTFVNSSCAVKSTTDPKAKYCVKAHKTVDSSKYTYITAFTRPDYQTACPPREPLKDAVFGTLSGRVCQPLTASSTSKGTAGQCGEAVFEASSDETPVDAGGTGWSLINWASWMPSSSGSSDGTCNLYSSVPTCLFTMHGAVSFTSLSVADPKLAVSPPTDAITPGPCTSNPCQNGGTCQLPDGTCKCSACLTGPKCEQKVEGCCTSDSDCSGNGTCTNNKCVCKPGYSGLKCETGKCDNVECKNGGTCTMPDGTCKCPDCFSGENCEIKNFRCCKTDADCHHPLGECVDGSCKCRETVTGDMCENSGCSSVHCANGGVCEDTTATCKCPVCFSGNNCEVPISNCCVGDDDCNAPNGVCGSNNQCECTDKFSTPNCEDRCKDVECGNGTCDPATGHCKCPPHWGGDNCAVPLPCGSGDEVCLGNTVCDEEQSKCVCKDGYTGEDCSEVVQSCAEICSPGGLLIREDASNCQVDCYSTCCRLVLDACKSKTKDDMEKCAEEELEKDEKGACCLQKEEGSSVALLAAAGVLAALLIAGAAGGVYYKTRSPGQPSSGNEADPTTGEPVGGKHRPTRAESAISVNFEDYANTPDDDDVGALNTQGEPAQEVVWDDDDA